MEYALAKVSTKGQIVIPRGLREDIQTGDQFLIIKDGERILLKNMDSLAADIREDLLFAERVERAWDEYDKGNFQSKPVDDFLKELEAC